MRAYLDQLYLLIRLNADSVAVFTDKVHSFIVNIVIEIKFLVEFKSRLIYYGTFLKLWEIVNLVSP
jgi:hypothetical protein